MRFAARLRKIFSVILYFIPALALADDVAPTRVDFIVVRARETLNYIIGILFILATVVFLWGVIQFIVKSSDEQGRRKAKGLITWGIVGLAVMAAIWGIVGIITTYFLGTNLKSPALIPKAPGTGGY